MPKPAETGKQWMTRRNHQRSSALNREPLVLTLGPGVAGCPAEGVTRAERELDPTLEGRELDPTLDPTLGCATSGEGAGEGAGGWSEPGGEHEAAPEDEPPKS